VELYEYVGGMRRFLELLAQAHWGVNYSIHGGGSNVKRFDYALAGLMVLSGGSGFRGEYLPGEASFLDHHDLACKLSGMSVGEAVEAGRANARRALEMYREARAGLLASLGRLLG
jgi:hypothetical protein